MKTSNILLSILFPLIFVVSIGSNFILKAEYDKLDKNDNFASYQKQKLPQFKHIKLDGATFGVTQIQPGKDYELRLIAEPKFLTWKMSGDTMHFTYHRDWEQNDRIGPEFQIRTMPTFIIYSPTLESVDSKDVVFKMPGWDLAKLKITQTKGAIQLLDSRIKNLDFKVQNGGWIKIDKDNKIAEAQMQVSDSSFLTIEKDVFISVQMHVDSAAHINVPGSLLK